MSSSSPAKPRPSHKTRRKYTEEQLQQVIHEHFVLGKTAKVISRELGISTSTIGRTTQLWELTGKVVKDKKNPTWQEKPPKLKAEVYEYLKAMVELDQHLTIDQIGSRLEHTFGVKPSRTTLHHTLKTLGWTGTRSHSTGSHSSSSSNASSVSLA